MTFNSAQELRGFNCQLSNYKWYEKKILIIAAICLQFLALAGEQNKPALGLSRKSAVELALRNN